MTAPTPLEQLTPEAVATMDGPELSIDELRWKAMEILGATSVKMNRVTWLTGMPIDSVTHGRYHPEQGYSWHIEYVDGIGRIDSKCFPEWELYGAIHDFLSEKGLDIETGSYKSEPNEFHESESAIFRVSSKIEWPEKNKAHKRPDVYAVTSALDLPTAAARCIVKNRLLFEEPTNE